MNRQEAISLITEIENECKDIVGRSFQLITPNEDNHEASGYQVQVTGKFIGNRSLCIEVIAANLGYSVKNNPEQMAITIFEPLKQKKTKKLPVIEETGIM